MAEPTGDKQLLEATARAAGYRPKFHSGDGSVYCVAPDAKHAFWWDPINNDGDALRLAVTLNIDHGNPGMRLSIDWSPSEDPYAATRRAIVRAAALCDPHQKGDAKDGKD